MKRGHLCRATEEQFLLLQAALQSGEAALLASREWRVRVNLDAVDAPSFAVLPLLYHNLRALGVEDPDMGRLAGVARNTWAGNQLALRAGTSALAALRDAEIDALVVDGAALSRLQYGDLRLRRLSGFDILVHLCDAERATGALSAAGWRMEPLYPACDDVIAFRDSARFDDSNGQAVMLWWRLWAGAGQDDEAETWSSARDITVNELTARALGPTDLLLRACAGLHRWGRERSLLWVADGLAILRAANAEVDWDRLARQARRLGLSLPTAEALTCLAETFDAPVPADALKELWEAPHSSSERILWKLNAETGEVWGGLPLALHRYGQLTQGRGIVERALMFPRYLQCVWNLRNVWQVPLHALRRGIQVLAHRRTGRSEPHRSAKVT